MADGVTLDFSKAQPLEGGVALDFSKAQPLEGAAPPAQTAAPFTERVGERLHQNLDLPAQIHNVNQMVARGVNAVQNPNPDQSLRGIIGRAGTNALNTAKGLYQQYKDPANIAADAFTAWMGGQMGEPGIAKPPAAAPPAAVESAPSVGKAVADTAMERLPGAVAKFATKRIPFYHTAKDIGEFVQDVRGKMEGPSPPPPPVPAVPAHWGREVGPPENWGKRIQPPTPAPPPTIWKPETPGEATRLAAVGTRPTAPLVLPTQNRGLALPPHVETPPIAVSSPPVATVATGLKGVEPALEQATGATKLKPDVPLREQLTKQPEHMGQFARANGIELDKALNAEQKAKVHALTNVQVRQLAINLGEDMGQDVIGRAKASGAVPRAEVFGRLLKDHTPAEIVKAIDAGKHLPEAQ